MISGIWGAVGNLPFSGQINMNGSICRLNLPPSGNRVTQNTKIEGVFLAFPKSGKTPDFDIGRRNS
jgi:hypothetical protein